MLRLPGKLLSFSSHHRRLPDLTAAAGYIKVVPGGLVKQLCAIAHAHLGETQRQSELGALRFGVLSLPNVGQIYLAVFFSPRKEKFTSVTIRLLAGMCDQSIYHARFHHGLCLEYPRLEISKSV